jgi:glutathione S-transferase
MYLYSTLVTATALMVYTVLSINVGKARGKYGVKAPATTGNEQFERVYRVQMNTLEQLALFLPALWLFAVNVRDGYAALLGLVWVVGRIMYAKDYHTNPDKRGKGFVVSFFAAIILLLGSVIGALVQG